MSGHIVLRLVLFCIFAIIGWQIGVVSSGWLSGYAFLSERYYSSIIAVFLGLVGFFSAPIIVYKPYRALHRKVGKVSARNIVMSVIGIVIGLVIAALFSFPLSMLPGRWGQIMPVLLAVLAASMGAMTMGLRGKDILATLGLGLGRESAEGTRSPIVLLDTSVIIDGRIADIRATGFVSGTMVVPRFVLDELQHIADSSDVLRRNRGRRGLDILNKMQKDESIDLQVSDMDARHIREVDGKLIKLAQELDCPVLTNDYNLNRVAELQGVQVLNINELANAVKAVMLPGENLEIRVIQEGKEYGQGVGYLDDGTMVVIEDGRRHMDSMVTIVVTRVLQTVAGRMIFGQIQDAKR